jgi:hypothetical protein
MRRQDIGNGIIDNALERFDLALGLGRQHDILAGHCAGRDHRR